MIRRGLYWATLSCFVIASGVLNIVQARRISQLSVQLDEVSQPGRDSLRPGAEIRSLSLRSQSGASIAVRLDDSTRDTALYIFRPGCHWCIKNAAAIKELSGLERGKCRMVGVSTSGDGLAEYVSKYGPDFETYGVASAETAAQLKLSATPQLIVVGSNGRVKRVWTGAFSGGTRDGIEAYFSVRLKSSVSGD